MQIAAWLKGLGLEQYETAFRANDVDAEVLSELSAEDLIGLGVVSIGHRRKILAAIAALRGSAPARARSAGVEANPPSDGAAPVLPEGERRQVAVLFADLAGYTKLSSEVDAEEVHGLLSRFFDLADGIVERYGGRIDKHIGDCAMAVFGAPVAYGNDAERAVRAALDIQAQVPALGGELGHEIGVHIGIASGQVVASPTGSDRRREYTVTGESVNLASRLTDEAGTGEILLSDAVHRALVDRLDCADAGDLTPKGFSRPIRAWRLLTLHEPAGSVRRPFVGRRDELGQFEAALAGCRGSGCGRTVFVRGQAGIGKTRLIEAFRRSAEELNFACHVALVLDFGIGTGQDAIRSLVRGLLGLSSASDSAAVEITAARTLVEDLITADQRAFLNDLLNLPQPTELRGLYDAMDNATRNRGKRDTVAALVRNLSWHRPLVLVVEDIHWADPLTLAHLATLAATVTDCSTILTMTSRTEGDPLDQAWRTTTGSAPITTIDLGPLRPLEAKAIADSYLEVLDETARHCIDRAAGNPLFLEQLLRHAEESADDGLPDSVQSLVQARVDRLDPLDKAALQAASVFGQRFSLDALCHLLGDPGYGCIGLLRQSLVRPEGEELLFAHALIREGVYGSLLNARKRDLHRSAASWYGGRDLVLHAKHLDLADDSAAPRAYVEAAQSQMAAYRSERALRLVERGIVLARERTDIHGLTCLQGELLHDLGSIIASVEAYRRALDFAEHDVERCRAWIGLAAGMRVTDRLDEAFQALEEAEAIAVAGGLLVEQSRIHHLRGNLFFPLGNIEGCAEQHDLALRCARQAHSPEAEARALGGLGDAAYVRGRMTTAHENFRRCVELCREHGFGRVEVANLNMAALTRQYANELRDAREDALAAVEAATKVGHQRAELLARNIAAFALYDLGELDLAKDHLGRALALIERLGARRFVPENLVYTAKVLRAEGRRADASEILERAMTVSRETGITFFGPRVLAEIALNTEDPKVRGEALAEGEAILRHGCVGHNHLWFYRDAMDTSLGAGNFDLVDRYASALEEYTHAEPLPWSAFFVARGRVLAAVGRGGCEETTLRELARLRTEAERVGFRTALPAVDQALANVRARQPRSPAGAA